MVKITCTGRNLLNHCNQIGNPADIKYDVERYVNYSGPTKSIYKYESIKNPGSSYICTLTFDGKTYVAAGSSKRNSIDNAVFVADGTLRTYI